LLLAAEIGPDLFRFPTEAQSCPWFSLAPATHISGGKPLPGHKPKTFNRAGQALRQASNARRSESYIGACHRALLAQMDTARAIKATAHQLGSRALENTTGGRWTAHCESEFARRPCLLRADAAAGFPVYAIQVECVLFRKRSVCSEPVSEGRRLMVVPLWRRVATQRPAEP
jgi:hypothetical protein